MNLLYINQIGSDYKGQKQYEFIFSKSTEIEVEEWFIVPASSSSYPMSPGVEYIDLVGLLKNTDIDLELIQNSDYFGVIDAVDGVVSLGWEKFDFDSEYQRLSFKFGESLDSVTKKLNSRGHELIKEEIKIEI